MAKAGDIIENPITFLKTTQETDGNLLRIEYVLPLVSPYPNGERRSSTVITTKPQLRTISRPYCPIHRSA